VYSTKKAMRYFLLLASFVFIFSGKSQLVNQARQGQEKKVQVAILFDTSNSMDGLINQARARIWSIINTLSKLEYQGVKPSLEISLYEYGNSGLSESTKFIRQLNGFTTDLDSISSSLFALSTNGGKEYCGSVISEATKDLDWSEYTEDIRLIYIAGNEPFDQGPDDYKNVLKYAQDRDIFVSTIYCGPYEKGVEELWLSAAEKGRGKYLNIDSDKKIKHISTPYDDTIRKLNTKLNGTYVSYGSHGKAKKSMQMKEDENAADMAPSSAVERTVSKSSGYYKNESWDLVDRVGDDESKLKDIKADQLPEELQGKSDKEKMAYLKLKALERKAIQDKIQSLGEKRADFIKEKSSEETDEDDDFGKAVESSIKSFALAKNYVLNN
tara:strand:+ start:58424 stop:59572 length:1149 start_codon:yes stop_codon:yes gene_type:complete